MKSIKIKYICFVLLIAIAGCRKDESNGGSVTNEPTGDPTIEVVSGVTGLVTNENGNPINNATVSIYNKSATTDNNGIFYVNNVGLKRENSTVHIEKNGYFDGFKSFLPALGKKSFVSVRLVERPQPAKIQSSTGGSVTIDGGAELALPPNSYVEKNGGGSYNGEVKVFTHYYDPLDADVGMTMPGNLLGVMEDESEVQLRTFGMVAVELESFNGTPLQLAEDAKAQLIFPAPNNLDPPSTIPLWYFDEIEGYWTQEGEATLSNGVYSAEVSHFSFWNCDAPFPVVKIEGRLISEGNPLPNFPLSITMSNGLSGFGYTDNEGVFRGKIPKGEDLLLTIRHCDELIVEQSIGPYNNDVILGDIEVELLNVETSIQGRLLGCFGQPAEDAYGLLRAGEKVVQVITPLADGTFFTTVIGCGNLDYTVQFFNPVTVKNTEIIDISTELELNDLMDVRVCDDLDEYIQFSVNGENALITETNTFFSNDNKLIVRGYEPGSFESFDFDVFASTSGDYNPSTVAIIGVGVSNPELTLMCGDHTTNYFSCDQFDLKILNFGSEYVSGEFSGVVVASTDSVTSTNLSFTEYDVQGSFRVKIDENITTGEISGQLWFDENGNNTREDDEDLAMRTQYVSLNRISGSGFSIFPFYINAYSQSYKFTDLRPGVYEVRVFNTSNYELVTNDVGSDDRDSDFSQEPNGYTSQEITITTDEIIENVDCGFILPSSVNCTSLFSSGCKPDITVGVHISGGVLPYTATLNGGSSIVVDGTATFNVPEGGVYFINVEDAIGNVCETEGSVKDYNNRVQGTVWRDLEGGTPNVYDSGEDLLLTDIPVMLHNEGGAIIGGTVSQQGKYVINNVPPGVHYISVDVPGGLTIVELNTSVAFGNDIDPATEQSGIFTVGDCNSYFTFDIGLK